MPEKRVIISDLYNDLFDVYQNLFPRTPPIRDQTVEEGSRMEMLHENAQFLSIGMLDSLMRKIDEISVKALAKGKVALNTIVTIDVKILLNKINVALNQFLEEARVFGDGTAIKNTIAEIRKFNDDLKIVLSKAAESLEEIQTKLRNKKVIDGNVVQKEIPMPALLGVLHEIVENVPRAQRWRHAQYTEYLIKSMEGWTDIPNLTINYLRIMEYAARGTTIGETGQSRNLNKLVDRLLAMEEDGTNLYFAGIPGLKKETDTLSPMMGSLVAAREFFDDINELVRKVMGIETVLEKTRLYGKKKLT
ncbi:MAG: hypothetical protein ACXAB4_13940, partial [Candidatus Hodarchaeales archaeon]